MAVSLHLWLSADSADDARHDPLHSARHPNDRSRQTASITADETIVAAIRRGNTAVFDTLYLRYYAQLAEYASSLTHDPAAAHDAVQDVFLNIWRDHTTWAPDHIAAYLFHAVRNRALNDLSARRRREQLSTRVGPNVAPGASEPPLSPDAQLHIDRFLAALNEAIDHLPFQRREVAVLRWRHGMSLAEIAAIVGTSVKAVSMQLTRTRAVLQDIVDTYVQDG